MTSRLKPKEVLQLVFSSSSKPKVLTKRSQDYPAGRTSGGELTSLANSQNLSPPCVSGATLDIPAPPSPPDAFSHIIDPRRSRRAAQLSPANIALDNKTGKQSYGHSDSRALSSDI